MKFNNKCVKNMYTLVLALSWVMIMSSCSRESAYSELLTKDYPELYTYVFDRNADSILTFIEHPKSHIREQAWRALINTPVKDIDDLLTQVQYANTDQAWAALSAHELTDLQISRLHDLWGVRTTLRDGINQVLGKQGNQESLNLLVRNFGEIIGEDSDYEYSAALAMGRLMIENEISEVSQRSILRYAAVLEDPELYRAYFYGLYRGGKKVEDETLLNNIWDGYEWVESPKIRQYIARICFNSDAEWTFSRLPLSDVRGMNVQLAVEIAQHSGNVKWSSKLEELYSKLLDHENAVVNEVALAQIENHPDKPAAFDEVIISGIVENEEKEASIRLSGLKALNDVSAYSELIESLSSKNPYLINKKLQIYAGSKNVDEYVGIIEEAINSSNHMEVLFGVQNLSNWWAQLDDQQKTSGLNENIRALIFDLLEKEERSITFAAVRLMDESKLINDSDYPRISTLLARYQLPSDIEVYQAFGGFFYDRFPDQAKGFIDSLAQQGYPALNNQLRSQGWDVPEMEFAKQSFRSPDWQRLGAMGYEPIWVLETAKGTIKIKMDVLSAPATISAMDSLTRAGAYDEIAFHRVVPNFVIQGGDVETGDGLGGAEFVLPTEGSELEYRRAKVGIASAGTDTEGSQYFAMHQWKPHLNGAYTLVGEVIEGMDVVDQILVGDKVEKAYWEFSND